MKSNWNNQPVTILGLSRSGIAAAQYLAAQGAHCFLSETMPATPANKPDRDTLQAMGVEIETGGHTSRCFDHSDFVVVSPGIPPSAQVLKELALSGKTIISEVELAYRETDVPLIGITGTNGKTTTTTLLSAILQQAGKQAPACGNIGVPLIEMIRQPADYYVVELSSFQLAFSPTLKAQIALFLNFRPDHLDWHGSVDSYKRAKMKLFTGSQAPAWAVLNADDPVSHEIENATTAQILWFSRDPGTAKRHSNYIYLDEHDQAMIATEDTASMPLLKVDQLQLVGTHNQENVLAASATAWLLGTALPVIESACIAFKGVEHRLEPVLTHEGITYYNDSKATNPDAALSALGAFKPAQVVLIAGGRDKKTDLSEFVASVQENARHVILIGEAADRFALELQTAGYGQITYADTLEDAVHKARALASPDIPVLFSPACASFDMFRNFEARGEAFKQVVHSLLKAPLSS